jgi:hypothetical protein
MKVLALAVNKVFLMTQPQILPTENKNILNISKKFPPLGGEIFFIIGLLSVFF